jgi:hypothetical protein
VCKLLGCAHDLHINLLLHNMDVRPTLLFGAALWGHHQLHADPMQHPFQPVFSTLLRQAFNLPACTAHWIVTLMAGQLPVQALIILEFCRFWARLKHAAKHNALIQACLFVQCTLARAGKDCWLMKWIRALQRVQPVAQALEDLLMSYGDPFFEGPCQHRKIALHFRCFWPGRWGKKPWYLWCDMPEKVWQSWVKMVSCNAVVPAQQLAWGEGAVSFAARRCKKCVSGAVANENHVLLHCGATESVRHTFQDRLVWPRPLHLPDFLRANKHSICAVFIHVCFHVYATRAYLKWRGGLVIWTELMNCHGLKAVEAGMGP